MGRRFRYRPGFTMHWKALLLAGCLPPLSGCLLAEHTSRNLFNEPTELLDNKKIAHRLRQEARTVWGQVCHQYPARTFSTDFVEGFTSGYVDYLESGGTAQPPAVPPIRYRRSRYMSVEGHAQIQDYFCGFKYGCDVAAASGKRDLITVPILLPEPPADTPVQARRVDGEPAKVLPRAAEPLPAPKPVDGGIGLPLLDRPLATNPTSIVPPNAPPPTIPVIEPPGATPVGPPKFNAPIFDFSPGPRSEITPTEALKQAAYSASQPTQGSGIVPPQREISNIVVKPLRNLQDVQPVPPWRGY